MASIVAGEDDESSEGEMQPSGLQPPVAAAFVVAGEDSEESDEGAGVGVHPSSVGIPPTALAAPSSASGATKPFQPAERAEGSKSPAAPGRGVRPPSASFLFRPTDPSSIRTTTPAVRALIAKNRKFQQQVPKVVNSKLGGLERTVSRTAELVPSTLNALQNVAVYAKVGAKDGQALCSLIDESRRLIPRFKPRTTEPRTAQGASGRLWAQPTGNVEDEEDI